MINKFTTEFLPRLLYSSGVLVVEDVFNLKLIDMKKIKLYIRTPLNKNQEYTICDEISDEVYASTGVQGLAIVIKIALENHMNNMSKN